MRRQRDRDAIADAVGRVLDPELERPLSELTMVRGVEVNRRGEVEVGIALVTEGSPMRDQLARDVTSAVRAVAGDADVRVDFSVMSERERRDTAARFMVEGHQVAATAARAIYAVASGKGGVGKSTVAANLAVSLAAQGKSVGLLDADVWGYSVPQLFGVHESPIALYETMLPVRAHGVRLMSLGFLVEDETPIVWRGPMLHKALAQFIHEVHWGDLDVLILDLPPGTGDVTLSVLELLEEASLLVVTTPQAAARTVATRVGLMARDLGMPVAGVVENMSAAVCDSCGAESMLFGSGGGQQLAAELDVPLLGQVPLDMALREGGDRGVPVVVFAPGSPSALALGDVASRLRPVRRSLLGRSLSLTPI